jgi:hypothetical protein
MSVAVLVLGDETTYPRPRDVKVLQFAIFLKLGSKVDRLNLFVYALNVGECIRLSADLGLGSVLFLAMVSRLPTIALGSW